MELNESCLKKAYDTVNGPRQSTYGTPEESFLEIAKMWSVIFKTEITSKQVALAMAALKICRETNIPKEDNIIDCLGYLHIYERIVKS